MKWIPGVYYHPEPAPETKNCFGCYDKHTDQSLGYTSIYSRGKREVCTYCNGWGEEARYFSYWGGEYLGQDPQWTGWEAYDHRTCSVTKEVVESFNLIHDLYTPTRSRHLLKRKGLLYKVNSAKPYDGVSVEFFPSGQLKNRYFYKDGLKDNSWTNPVSFQSIINDSMPVQGIYAGGDLYEAGLKCLSSQYSENGTLRKRSYYHGGKLQLFDRFSEEGKMVLKQPKIDETDVYLIGEVLEYPNS